MSKEIGSDSSSDITERKQQEDQLRQAQKTEAIGQLTGGVAHDFNNVLAIIRGNLDMAETIAEKSSEMAGYLGPAIEAAESGAALTHRLLAFARKQTLEIHDVDVGALLDGMDDMLRRSLGETIEIEIRNAPALWICGIDSGQLEQSLINLAVNARDAMPDGGRLTIETENARIDDAQLSDVTPGEYVLLEVSDTGVGMSSEVQEKIFDPFFTTKEVGKGTGLGLSMVFGFVKQSRGHVTVRSELGQGTTFRLYLPRSRAATATSKTTELATETPKGSGEFILVVEDEENLQTMIKVMLEKLGYTVSVVGDALEAQKVLSSPQQIDLLLSDVVLPGGVSGPALAKEALRDRTDLKVLLMSGYTRDALPTQDRPDSGVELLAKPFTRNNLGRKLREVLDT